MNICVYGASSNEIDPIYTDAARELGSLMARHGHGLVFGGGAHGMMGAVACGAHEANGSILGIAPSFFHVDGVLYDQCTRFITTETMRERKQLMEEHSDAFVMTAGGIGTFEEFFEVLTLKQLGRHNKPIAVLNTNGYFNDLFAMLHTAVDGRFLKSQSLTLFSMCAQPEQVLEYIEQYRQAPVHVKHLRHIP